MSGYPKIISVKMTPCQAAKDITGKYKERRRLFNQALDLAVTQYGKYYTVNPDCIIPSDNSAYKLSSGYLCEAGFQRYWKQLNDLIRNKVNEEDFEGLPTSGVQSQNMHGRGFSSNAMAFYSYDTPRFNQNNHSKGRVRGNNLRRRKFNFSRQF